MRLGRIGQLLDDGLRFLRREPVSGSHCRVTSDGGRHGVARYLEEVLGLDRGTDGGAVGADGDELQKGGGSAAHGNPRWSLGEGLGRSRWTDFPA